MQTVIRFHHTELENRLHFCVNGRVEIYSDKMWPLDDIVINAFDEKSINQSAWIAIPRSHGKLTVETLLEPPKKEAAKLEPFRDVLNKYLSSLSSHCADYREDLW